MYCKIYNNGLYNTLLTCPTYWCLSNCVFKNKDRCESVQLPRYTGRSLHTNHRIDHLKMCKSCRVDKGRLHFTITMQMLNLTLPFNWSRLTIRKRDDIVFINFIFIKYIILSWIFWFDIAIFCIYAAEFCFRVNNHAPSLSISLFH